MQKELSSMDLAEKCRSAIDKYSDQGGKAFNPYRLGVEEKYGSGLWFTMTCAMFRKIVRTCYENKLENQKIDLKSFTEKYLQDTKKEVVDLFRNVQIEIIKKEKEFNVGFYQDVDQKTLVSMWFIIEEKEGFSPNVKIWIFSNEHTKIHDGTKIWSTKGRYMNVKR